jgi:hypothetical protein
VNHPTLLARRACLGWFAGAFAVAGVLLLGNLPLLSGRHVPRWDAVDFFEPSFALAGDALRAGQLLKWDPWSGGGAPDWAEPELGATSPVLLAASALPLSPRHDYLVYWFSVWIFGGLGMLLLAKHAGCPASGGTIVACGFAASGFFTGHAEHMSSLYSVAFLPWILWRFDTGLERRDWQYGVQAGALYGLSALGGYPEFTVLTPGFLALWALARVLTGDDPVLRPRASVGSAAAVWIATVAVGALIFSPPYAGLLLRTRGYTDAAGPRPRDVSISSNLLPAGALSTFASPYLANLNLAPNPLWPSTDISMTSIYTGAAVLVLAVFALRRLRSRWPLAAIAAFFLLCALGSQLPLRGWLYDLAAPTRYFRNPALFRAYVILTLCFLAAIGARDLREVSSAERAGFWQLAAVMACCSTAVFEFVSRISGKSAPYEQAGAAHLGIAWFGLAVLAYLWKQGLFGARGFLGLAAALACLDALGAVYISRPEISDAPAPWLLTADAAYNPSVDLTNAGLERELLPPGSFGPAINNRNLLNKAAVLDDYTTRQVLRNRFHRAMIADPDLSRLATHSNRIWFSASPLWLAPSDSNFGRFQQRVDELGGQPILVLHSPEQMLAIAMANPMPASSQDDGEILSAAPSMPAPISSLTYKPDLLSFRYQAPSRGYLLVTDRWADGWEVTVNGQSRPVLGADFIYRAVEVNPGANVVQFRYNPAGFVLLLTVSWGTLALAFLWQGSRLLGKTS